MTFAVSCSLLHEDYKFAERVSRSVNRHCCPIEFRRCPLDFQIARLRIWPCKVWVIDDVGFVLERVQLHYEITRQLVA